MNDTVAPGAHRLEGSARIFVDGAPPRDVSFAFDVEVAEGEAVDGVLDLMSASRGEVAMRRA
mgnify:CR=1 FL=1